MKGQSGTKTYPGSWKYLLASGEASSGALSFPPDAASGELSPELPDSGVGAAIDVANSAEKATARASLGSHIVVCEW